MEAVPKLPMLSFELRSNPQKNAQFGPDISNFIRQYYHEDPNNYINEMQTLDKLRLQAMKPSKDLESCSLLKRYLCQLYFLQKRFPMLKDGPPSSDISWKDLLSSNSRKIVDFRIEWAITLYNIGALHTQLGASDDRTTPEGLKLACTHFQCAAWAFQCLQEENTITSKLDFDLGFFQFLIPTCLAQAQECIVEKSMTDNRKPYISAKVATQICEYYGIAMNAVTQVKIEGLPLFDVTAKNSHTWLSYIKYKKTYYECIANLFLGIQAEEDEKMGERVAFFELAAEKLKVSIQYAKFIEAPKLCKGLDEALCFTRDVVEAKRKNSVNENDFIYHKEVPPKDSLPKVKGAALVKCIGFEFSDPEISGQDIFSKLISLEVHKLASIYSEEKAKLLRGISSKVEEKDAELISFMQSLKLDYLNTNEDPNALPEELIEKCAAYEAKSDLEQNLIDSTNKLAEAHHEVENMMKEITELIEIEESAEKDYQKVMNTTRPPSIVTTDLKCEANRYLEALKKATESNASLNNAISAHVNNLRVLSLPLNELQKQLPHVSFEYSSEEESIIKELKRLVEKVEEMKNQRTLLMLQLRDSLRNDDITTQLIITDENKNTFSAVIAKELLKHENIVNLMEQNLKAQTNILKAITYSYASYAPIRKIIYDTIQQRSLLIKALIESFDVSDDVLKKTAKGLEFYRKLETNVKKLLSRVRGTCKVQEEERTQMYLKTGRTNVIPPRSNSATVFDRTKNYSNNSKITTRTNTPNGNVMISSNALKHQNTFPSSGNNATPYLNGNMLPIQPAQLSPSLTQHTVPYTSASYPINMYVPSTMVNSTTRNSYSIGGSQQQPIQNYMNHSNATVSATFPNTSTMQPINMYSSISTNVANPVNGTNYPTRNLAAYPNSNMTSVPPVSIVPTPSNINTPITYENHTVGTYTPSVTVNSACNYTMATALPTQNNYSNSNVAVSTHATFNPAVATYGASYPSSVIMNTSGNYPYTAAGVGNTVTQMQYQHQMASVHPNIQMNSVGGSATPLTYTPLVASQNPVVTQLTDLNYVSIGSPTCSSASRYTNAGQYGTTNIESSTKNFDGYSYAIQYASSNSSVPSTKLNSNTVQQVSPIQQYYTSQYGYHANSTINMYPNDVFTNHNMVNDVPITFAKRNSVTYMQAGSNDNNNVVSASTRANSMTTTSVSVSSEDKKESNIDLLADLDFNVPDEPLVPISVKAAPQTQTTSIENLMVDEVTKLTLNNTSTTTTNSTVLNEIKS